MLHDDEKHRTCRLVVDSLNATHSWNLSGNTLQEYYDFAIATLDREPELALTVLHACVQNYHADHQHVEAICDTGHAQHQSTMLELRATLTRILASKSASAHRPDDGLAGDLPYAPIADTNPRPGSAALVSFGGEADWQATLGAPGPATPAIAEPRTRSTRPSFARRIERSLPDPLSPSERRGTRLRGAGRSARGRPRAGETVRDPPRPPRP